MAIEITNEGDMRVRVDGNDVSFWFGGREAGINAYSPTKIWLNLTLPPAPVNEQQRRKAAYERRYRNWMR